MNNKILGLHHITAIAGDPQRNYDFYTKVLGLRLVKKTVNFDDPQTYHFYYGNEVGAPGTILTFFPWPRVRQGKNGTGMATEIRYAVPEGSLTFWEKCFDEMNVPHSTISELFGEQAISFNDPDGLNLKLIVPGKKDDRAPWSNGGIDEDYAIRGFHSVALTLRDIAPTAKVLTEVLGYTSAGQHEIMHRFHTAHSDTASVVDIIHNPDAPAGVVAGGTNHHVAFRVKDEDTLMKMREKVLAYGLHITEKIDRQYFYSLYFREPGGVLFEIATDNPGFVIDENAEVLGHSLKLPDQYEPYRSKIEKVLPVLTM